jgi:general secretion pathway protein K
MLTVALVGTFGATALWQQWRSIEVEGAERARIQSEWILNGALDWARLLLREDARSGGPDHLGEPWAVPLEEARLSSFLAAQDNVSTDAGTDVLDAFLSGQVTDLQSFLNVSNLANNGKLSEPDLEKFDRLFSLLQLPSDELDQLAANLTRASATGPGDRPLMPQRVDQLVWLGLSPQTVAALRPYITVLPTPNAPVNINTASAEVIYAAAPALSMPEAQHLVADRDALPFRSLADASRLLGQPPTLQDGQGLAVASSFFEVRARLRLDQLVVEERSVVRRDGIDVKVVQRERGPAGPPPAAPGSNR